MSSLLTCCVARSAPAGQLSRAPFPWGSLCLASGDPATWLSPRGDVPLPSAVIPRLPGTSGGSFLRHSLLHSVCRGQKSRGAATGGCISVSRPAPAGLCPCFHCRAGRRQVAVRGRAPLRSAAGPQRERRSRFGSRAETGERDRTRALAGRGGKLRLELVASRPDFVVSAFGVVVTFGACLLSCHPS